MNDENPSSETEANPVDPALVESAKAMLASRGGSTRQMVAMAYPAPVFNELFERLCDRRVTTDDTFEWLINECGARDLDAPSKSAMYRFAAVVREEYRLAQFADRRRQAEAYIAEATAGVPGASQMVLNTRLTELITQELLDADDGKAIETKRLFALTSAVRAVAQTAFDKQKMDVRIQALQAQIEHRNKTIVLLEQRIAKLPDQVKAVEEKLAHVEQAQAQGKKVDASVYAAIRAELIRVKEAA